MNIRLPVSLLVLLALAAGASVSAQAPTAPKSAVFQYPSFKNTPADWDLIEAVEGQDLAKAVTAFQNGAHLDARDAIGDTPLMQAALYHNLPLFRMLLGRGAAVNVTTSIGTTALTNAAAGGNSAIIHMLIAHGADVRRQGPEAIAYAALNDRPEIIRLLMHYGVPVDARTMRGETALMQAFLGTETDFAAARFLISHGANVNARDNDGGTALRYVFGGYVNGGDISTPKLLFLMHNGANVLLRDNDGGTVLMNAVGSSGVATRLLIGKGVPVNAHTKDGKTALMLAAASGQTEAVRLLLQNGAAVNARDNDGYTALMRAAKGTWRGLEPGVSEKDYADIAALLVAHGADLSCKDSTGETALTLAQQTQQTSIVQTLEAGAPASMGH